MDITASAKYVRISPQKMILVAREIQNMSPKKAITHLRAMNKKGARLIADVIQSADANAKNSAKVNNDNLIVKSVNVTRGITMKRFRPAARGAAHVYTKKTSHITAVLAEKDVVKKPVVAANTKKSTEKKEGK